jgi:hypothetical protein
MKDITPAIFWRGNVLLMARQPGADRYLFATEESFVSPLSFPLTLCRLQPASHLFPHSELQEEKIKAVKGPDAPVPCFLQKQLSIPQLVLKHGEYNYWKCT